MNCLRLATIVTVIVALLLVTTVHAVEVVGPYTHIYYLDEIASKKTVILQPGQKYAISFGLPPGENYVNYRIVVEFEKSIPTVQIVCGDCMVERDSTGLIRKVYAKDKIVLINTGTAPCMLKLKVKYVYARIIERSLKEPIEIVEVEVPDETGLSVSRQIVKLVIDNDVPYIVQDVVLPGNVSMRDLVLKGKVPEGVKFELKAVEIDAGKAPHGVYKIVLRYDKSGVLPTAMLLKALQYINTTVTAKSEIVISSSDFGVPKGWKVLGYIIAVATIQPEMSVVGEPQLKIVSDYVTSVRAVSGLIDVKTITYLIPALVKFRYVVGVYVTYGKTVKIVNNMSAPVLVYYIPLLYKPVGEIMRVNDTLVINVHVAEPDLTTGLWTVLIVQLPYYAEILKIVTPGGISYTSVTSSVVPWGTSERPISISPDRHEAYITLALGDVREPGIYRIFVKLTPLKLVVVSTSGKPVQDVLLVAKFDGKVVVKKPDVNGQVEFKLGTLLAEPIVVEVVYRNVTVKKLIINTVPVRPVRVLLELYNLTVVVTNFRGEPIADADVVLTSIDGKLRLVAKTDSRGIAVFMNVPRGIYIVKAVVGGSTLSEAKIELDSNRVLRLNTSLIIVINLGGWKLPITAATVVYTIVAGIAVAIIAVAVPLKLRGWLSRRGEVQESEYIIEER